MLQSSFTKLTNCY